MGPNLSAHERHERLDAPRPASPRRKRYFIHGLLPQLIAFEACIRHGSVTEAARELRIAQPTVSCMLRKLSLTFGSPLALRRAGRMEPTARGEEVLSLCADMLEVLDRFDSRDAAVATHPVRSLEAVAST